MATVNINTPSEYLPLKPVNHRRNWILKLGELEIKTTHSSKTNLVTHCFIYETIHLETLRPQRAWGTRCTIWSWLEQESRQEDRKVFELTVTCQAQVRGETDSWAKTKLHLLLYWDVVLMLTVATGQCHYYNWERFTRTFSYSFTLWQKTGDHCSCWLQ